jgi:hypothetical protein
MKEDALIEKMKANRFMRSRAEVIAFEEAMAELAKNPKNEYLSKLHLVLDDECEHYEVMYGLIHFLESFDEKEQLQTFIDVAPKLILQAQNWTKTLLYGILNDEPSRTLYKQLLQSANSESRDVVCQLLKEIATNESPPLSSRAEFVLAEGATLVN